VATLHPHIGEHPWHGRTGRSERRAARISTAFPEVTEHFPPGRPLRHRRGRDEELSMKRASNG
jgi:hypothetical protein